MRPKLAYLHAGYDLLAAGEAGLLPPAPGQLDDDDAQLAPQHQLRRRLVDEQPADLEDGRVRRAQALKQKVAV